MKRLLLVLISIVVIGLGWYASVLVGQDPPVQITKAAIMRMKLEPAKKILEGIALHDFKSVRKHTEQIRLLTLDESWMLLQTEQYVKQTQAFERSLNLLNRMCEEENIDGVTLAYMQVTMRCVECHSSLRDSTK